MSAGQGSIAPTEFDTLALHLLEGTEQAALACRAWVGRGDGKAADQAAVTAMRQAFESIPGGATVVIGEGEKDQAPMLYVGETLGSTGEPAYDIAVDPLENTTACANMTEGAIAVVAAGPRGTLLSTPAWYMDKIVVNRDGVGAVDIRKPVEENLAAVAEATGKPVSELTVVVLDKPRHQELIGRLHDAGARVVRIPDGDVLGALRVVMPDGDADLLVGIGGAPEGIVNAVSVRLLGGDMQARLAPQYDEEREQIVASGQDLDTVLTLDELVGTGDCCMVATGITDSQLLRGLAPTAAGWRTCSLVLVSRRRTLIAEALHDNDEGH